MSKYRDKLYPLLSDFFSSRGYFLIKTRDCYEKKFGDITYTFKLYFHHRSSELAIEIIIGIVHMPTHKIHKKATGKSYSNTIGCEAGCLIHNIANKDYRITKNEYFDIIISPGDSLDYAYEKITFILYEIAVPYYKEFGSLDIIDKVLNDKPTIISLHKNEQYFRYSTGLIIAKLNNRKNYKELKQQYDILVQEMSEVYIERYNQVKDYLKNI